ncbi:MAG: HAD family phosphatase [Niabella sp.]
MRYKAFLFDLNGTIIDDMQYHTDAWYDILNNKLGANLSYEKVKKEMYGKNIELLQRVFGADRFTLQEMEEISFRKEEAYQENFRPMLKWIEGFGDFVEQAYQRHIKMAIGSAAIIFNIDFVLDGLHLRKYFDAIVSADDVQHSKPNPETYLKCAEKLGVLPAECLVFEDAPKGVESALNAGMDAAVILSCHEKKDFNDLSNVKCFFNDYYEKELLNLVQ